MNQSEPASSQPEPNTLAEILLFAARRKLPKLKKLFDDEKITPEVRDKFLRISTRYYEPWPQWVLRVLTEILAVYFSSIEKRGIFEGLKVIHWFFFEAEIHGDSKKMPEFNFPPDFFKNLVGIIGHAQKHSDLFTARIEEAEELLGDKNAVVTKIKAEHEENRKKMAGLFVDYLKKKSPEKYLPIMEKVVKAGKSTVDTEGRLRETRATPIYQKIFDSWMEIEMFSGPMELCQFLDPVLEIGDSETKYDRVKKIVTRMGI